MPNIEYTGIGNMGGVLVAGETFLRESFKGNHKKSKTFTMPQKAHKRGTKGSPSRKVQSFRYKI